MSEWTLQNEHYYSNKKHIMNSSKIDRQLPPWPPVPLSIIALPSCSLVSRQKEVSTNNTSRAVLSPRDKPCEPRLDLEAEEFYCRLLQEVYAYVRAEYIGNPLFVIVMPFRLVPSLGALLLSMKLSGYVDLAALSCFVKRRSNSKVLFHSRKKLQTSIQHFNKTPLLLCCLFCSRDA